jgi:hypothetical protein
VTRRISVRGASEFRVLKDSRTFRTPSACANSYDSDGFGQFGRLAIISFGLVAEISAQTAVWGSPWP